MVDADLKTWYLIAATGDPKPENSLTYRGGIVLYPSEEMAQGEMVRLIPPDRRDQFEVVPAKVFVALEGSWRIVPVEMLALMEKDGD